MSNLLKSKFFYGVLIVAVMFAAVGVINAEAQTTTTVVASGYTYSGVMKVGMRGPGISTLQAALNQVNAGGTIVVDGSFGPATLAAVKMFQMSHGLGADGVVGPMTGAALAQATVGVITVPTNGCSAGQLFNPLTGAACTTAPSNGCPAGALFNPQTGASCTSGSNNNNLSGGETSIGDVSMSDADDDTINEGASKVKVGEIEFDVDDADAQLVRADVVFQLADGNTGEDKPWRAFDKVYLMDGTTTVASMSADDEDNWDDADGIGGNDDNDAFRVRFNNVNKTYKEDDNASLFVAVDVASSVDGSDTGEANWVVGVDENGLRFTDGAGLDTEADTDDTADFSVEESGQQSEFTVSEADNSPDSNTIEIKENQSTESTIAIFTVDTDEDGGDVKINDFPVGITMNVAGASTFATVVDKVYVTIDGTKYEGDYVTNSCDVSSATLADCTDTQTATFTFDDIEDDDITIDAGDSIDVKVSVKFKSQGTNTTNGTTILASSLVDDNDVEDADTGDDIGDVDGDAEGETMTLQGSGIMVEINSATNDITEIDGVTNDTATFKWNIDVTAFGDDDVFINRDSANIVLNAGLDADDVDIEYIIEKSSGTMITGSGTIADNSDADEVIGDTGAYGGLYNGELFFKIRKNTTETFTITVTATNTADNKQVRAKLIGIEFTTDLVDDDSGDSDADAQSIRTYTANLAEDSQTDFENIQ